MDFIPNTAQSPELIIAGQTIKPETAPTFGDDRGYFTAINFGPGSKRAYLIQNHQKWVVRAFHGHHHESKQLYVLSGAFKVIVIDMQSKNWKSFTLTEKGNNLLKIPAGCFNGFVSITDDAQLLIFSDRTFEESKADDIRLPYDLLGTKVWEVEHR